MYTIGDNTKFVLYGAAFAGGVAYERLLDMGLCAVGFIDKRAMEIKEYRELPVWDIDTLPAGIIDDKNIVIIVSVKNVFEHSIIASRLVKKGLKKIIYKPFDVLCGNPDNISEMLSEAYEAIYDGTLKNRHIPCVEIANTLIFKDAGLIKDDGREVTAYVPVEFVFTNDGVGTWSDRNIATLLPHFSLFRAIEGKEGGDFNYYIEQYCIPSAKRMNVDITEKWKQNVLNNRTQVFEQMILSMQIDKDFFVRNASRAVWNEDEAHFNLKEGKFRTSFLFYKGQRYIPLRIEKEQYVKYINIAEVQEVCNIIEQNEKVLELYIPHPYFIRKPTMGSICYYEILQTIIESLADEFQKTLQTFDLSNISLIDGAKDRNDIMRGLIKSGCKVVTMGEQGYISKKIDELVCIKNNEKKYKSEENYVTVLDLEKDIFDKKILEYCKLFYTIGKSGKLEMILPEIKKSRIKTILREGEYIDIFMCQGE